MARLERLTNSSTGGPVHVEVADGKIVRILPIDLDDSDAASWQIEARGRTFAPPRRTTLSPWTVAHKSSIYSPKRILTPLKRVDFDPSGAPGSTGTGGRNRRNRGVSGTSPSVGTRPSRWWPPRSSGPSGNSAPPECSPPRARHHTVGQRRLTVQCLLPVHRPGRHDLRRAQPRQLGGVALGRHPYVGLQPPSGHPRAARPSRGRAQEHRDAGVLVGRPGMHLRRDAAFESSIPSFFWLKESGVKMVFIDPYFNHTAGLHSDKWMAPRPGTDVARRWPSRTCG